MVIKGLNRNGKRNTYGHSLLLVVLVLQGVQPPDPQGRVQGFFIAGAKTETPKAASGGSVLGDGTSTPSPTARESGKRCDH